MQGKFLADANAETLYTKLKVYRIVASIINGNQIPLVREEVGKKNCTQSKSKCSNEREEITTENSFKKINGKKKIYKN